MVHAATGKEAGESGTRHLQGYIHFRKLKCQLAVHAFFGCDSPCMHLSVQGKEGASKKKFHLQPAFRHCMKEDDHHAAGKNLVEMDMLKEQTKVGTGRCSDACAETTNAIEKGEVNGVEGILQIDAEQQQDPKNVGEG